jgi:hypothetical protein
MGRFHDVRMFLGNCAFSGVEIITATHRRLALSTFTSKIKEEQEVCMRVLRLSRR